MAGGKETPRQKLIGLMYLVLLALLALQVSSAIIEKFQSLNESIEASNKNTINRNASAVSRIKDAVDNQPRYKEVYDKASEVRKNTTDLLNYLENLKTTLIDKTGGRDPETNAYLGAKEETKIEVDMVGAASNPGEAFAMQEKLNQYSQYLNTVSKKTKFDPLALDGKDDPALANNPQQRRKNFAELNFAQTPLVAALAVISEKQARVATMEATVLSELAEAVGAKDVKIKGFKGMARPEAKYVAAGTKYKADIFLTADLDASSGIDPTMRFKGASLPVNNGVGTVEFTAAASNYDAEGNYKTKWSADISYKKPDGTDTTIVLEEEYFVVKPVMQVTSASVSALYYNCGNDLSVQVPALGATYAPSFSATGANTLAGSKRGEVIVIPTNNKQVTLNVASNGNAIGSQTFKVRPVPNPDIVAMVGSREVNLRNGEAAPGPASVLLRAVPDPGFASQLPNEARYGVVQSEVILARGKQLLQTINATGPNINLTQIRNAAQTGDRIIITVKKVQRKNFKDQIEDVDIPASASIIQIPIN
jgi:gliding motility-associated protein GldM